MSGVAHGIVNEGTPHTSALSGRLSPSPLRNAAEKAPNSGAEVGGESRPRRQ